MSLVPVFWIEVTGQRNRQKERPNCARLEHNFSSLSLYFGKDSMPQAEAFNIKEDLSLACLLACLHVLCCVVLCCGSVLCVVLRSSFSWFEVRGSRFEVLQGLGRCVG